MFRSLRLQNLQILTGEKVDMSKAFFRFLRGELNGFYVTNLYNICNTVSNDMKKFIIDFYKQQFEHGEIEKENLYNLGKTAGIFIPRIPLSEIRATIHFSETDEVNGHQYSERGLYLPDDEDFKYEMETQDEEGLPDINTLATPSQRSSMVGTEQPLGYIPYDEEHPIDDEGYVKPDVVLPNPPVNKAYSEFYGDEFLFLSEAERTYLPLSYAIYLELFKAIQWIRYNGMSVASLARITELLCPQGLVIINSITVSNENNRWLMNYTVNMDVDINLKTDRLNMLLYILRIKFPQVEAVENNE